MFNNPQLKITRFEYIQQLFEDYALTADLAGFGLALGLPFGLFAVFPQWLQRMPKSGGWLDIVKKILAFVELAFSFKFLSNADLVAHWGLLKRETFIIISIAITLGLAVYLLFRHHFGFQIVSIGVLFMVFYIGMDFTGLDLPLISGFAPPRSTGKVKPAITNHFDKALAIAKKQHKPVLVDFTGWACVNCRKMEEHI